MINDRDNDDDDVDDGYAGPVLWKFLERGEFCAVLSKVISASELCIILKQLGMRHIVACICG
jgi:hypothetical protein